MEIYINYILGALLGLFVLALIIKYKSYILKQAQEALAYIQSDDFKTDVYKLMAEAEKNLDTPTGQARLKAVCEKALALIPTPFNKFVTTQMLVDLVNSIFDKYAVKKDGHTVIE